MSKKYQVKEFFKIFINGYLINDLIKLNSINKDETTGLGACSIPQAMMILSGIDLLGLLFGEDKNVNNSGNHILNFYRITKNVYKHEFYTIDNINLLIQARHGMMHNFFPKFKNEYLGICKSSENKLFVTEMVECIELESLNVSFLTNDFFSAVSYLENLIESNSDDSFFDNIILPIKQLEDSNRLATTTQMTTMNIITQNKRYN